MKRVYFLKPIGADGPVKIGCSADPVARLKQLMVWSPLPLEIAAMIPGSESEETGFHGMFASQRLHGEWFAASEALTMLMDDIRHGRQLAIDPDEFAEAKSAMRVACGFKSGLTRKLQTAEREAARAGLGIIRPDHIRQILAEYTGPDKPAPTLEHRALVEAHVRELRAMLPPRRQRRELPGARAA